MNSVLKIIFNEENIKWETTAEKIQFNLVNKKKIQWFLVGQQKKKSDLSVFDMFTPGGDFKFWLNFVDLKIALKADGQYTNVNFNEKWM